MNENTLGQGHATKRSASTTTTTLRIGRSVVEPAAATLRKRSDWKPFVEKRNGDMLAINHWPEPFQRPELPMRRNLPQPRNPRFAHGGVGVQAFGDRMTDDGLTFLFEQGDELLLLLEGRLLLLLLERRLLLLLLDEELLKDSSGWAWAAEANHARTICRHIFRG